MRLNDKNYYIFRRLCWHVEHTIINTHIIPKHWTRWGWFFSLTIKSDLFVSSVAKFNFRFAWFYYCLHIPRHIQLADDIDRGKIQCDSRFFLSLSCSTKPHHNLIFTNFATFIAIVKHVPPLGLDYSWLCVNL